MKDLIKETFFELKASKEDDNPFIRISELKKALRKKMGNEFDETSFVLSLMYMATFEDAILAPLFKSLEKTEEDLEHCFEFRGAMCHMIFILK